MTRRETGSEVPLLYSEGNAAARVALEREVRGWSTTELAARMTQAGVPMNQTAVWRIESGTPRRKITLDEALGFARVFELPLEELMSPPLEGVDLEGRRVVQEAVEAFYASRDAEDRLHQAVVAIADYLRTRPDASNGVHEQCLRLMGEERDARALTDYIESGGYYH
ncbi:helix-turn-helix domain-containing protein [Streptomyces chiangmaiensis]|jgi:transcriptional regulator with XRE-family HTH domain|uniref:Helix-turn-helix transcriptional regulator n=1 Tax=Streptomyces chiangmaiensis TaxID=766497 RepID=A0ABU7FJ93_9ACTN|nr:helix-turn-helix transcriptional regulator [Streptomyces chiangmaiensis]MED7824196.1 helix-turn-helix transcriptional regulator [Streptomyces chiangmaiensis]